MTPPNRTIAIMGTFAIAFLCAGPAAAYIGPGSGVSAIGTVVAVMGAGFLLIVGFVWYPIKRLLRRGKPSPETTEDSITEEQVIGQDTDREN